MFLNGLEPGERQKRLIPNIRARIISATAPENAQQQAFCLDTKNLNYHENIRRVIQAAVFDLADVHQTVALAKEVHKSAEIDDLHDLALVDHALLGLGHNRVDREFSGSDNALFISPNMCRRASWAFCSEVAFLS